eukprot:Phypoly_transcript_07247.p1 GENE.Phypoly_transcript_07247~~Phypoly_transcript_07247.p1  ORF type:complete len:496 (+),score=26.67 Phypoly_transcript_07247:110-1597(+)
MARVMLWLFMIVMILVMVAPRGVYSQNSTTNSCTNTTKCPLSDSGKEQCCSSQNQCGTGALYCATGCTSGPCWSTTNPNPDQCKAGPCNDPTLCCSTYYFCGTTDQHCGSGCRSGPCNVSAPTVNPITVGGCTSLNTCVDPTECCSSYMYCGLDEQHCGSNCIGGACWPGYTHTSMKILYSPPIGIGLGIVVGICILLAIWAEIVLIVKRQHFARQGPFYCGIINFGVIIGYISAVLVLVRQTDILCIAFPWVLGIAFNLVYGCLFIKTWVIYGMFRRAAQLKKVSVDPFYILKLLAVFLTIEIIFLVIWTILDPPKVYHLRIDGTNVNSPYEIQCRNKQDTFWIIFVAGKGIWLLTGGVLCFLMRKVTKEYNKSKVIAYSIYNNVLIILLAVPLCAILQNVKYAMMVVKVVGIICSFSFILFTLNFSVWYKIFYAKFDIVAGMLKIKPEHNSSTTTPSTTGAASTYSVSSMRGMTSGFQTTDLHSGVSTQNPPS